MRRNLSSFFKWLEDENYIFKSPLRRIHKIKTSIPVRETYADEELEKLRDDCKELRNPALFVTIRNPHHRLKAGGVEIMLKKMGEDCNVNHVHPHKFRRTMATTAIDKGMPIEQEQHLLGHEKIDTTLHYAMVKQSNVKMAQKKYIG